MADLIAKLYEDREYRYDTKKLVDEDDDVGFISTNDINEIINVEAKYIPLDIPEKIAGYRTSFKRNQDTAKKSIQLANYKCDLDESHSSFISKNGKAYMEAHHLIPLSTQEYFDYSLDVDANIICLCPNCHRKLHYGQDIIGDLLKLYNDRLHSLTESGIIITFNDLCALYQL